MNYDFFLLLLSLKRPNVRQNACCFCCCSEMRHNVDGQDFFFNWFVFFAEDNNDKLCKRLTFSSEIPFGMEYLHKCVFVFFFRFIFFLNNNQQNEISLLHVVCTLDGHQNENAILFDSQSGRSTLQYCTKYIDITVICILH